MKVWLATLAAVYAITLGIKQMVKRERPGTESLMYGPGADVHSFPSGHATRMGAMLAWFGTIFPGFGWLGWPLTLWVSWSRVAMGVHYAGDVIVGLAVGFLTGEIARRHYKKQQIGRGFDGLNGFSLIFKRSVFNPSNPFNPWPISQSTIQNRQSKIQEAL